MTTKDAVKKCIDNMDEPMLKTTLKQVVESNDIIKEGLFRLLLDENIIVRQNGGYVLRKINIKLE